MGIHFLHQVQTYDWKKWLILSFSPSDGDISEEKEYARIMSTNNATVVENVDETSNLSNCNHTQILSVSFIYASTEFKYRTCLSFYTIWILPNIIY